jgi:hypothetical protein
LILFYKFSNIKIEILYTIYHTHTYLDITYNNLYKFIIFILKMTTNVTNITNITNITKSSTKRLNLSISQIAPLIGLDAYNNFPRIVCEIWRKYNPDDFKLIESKLKEEKFQIATSNEYNDLWETDEASGTNILQQVKDLNLLKDKSSNDMVKQQDIITKYINEQSNLTDVQKIDLTKKVCSITNKTHGITNEDSILTEFCRLSEKTITHTNQWVNSICINNECINESNIEWYIIGKYDGITSDNELVEAKMRQKCLFKKVRDYENVQVQLYLHALEFENAFLVESYTNKKGEMNIYVNEIKYDSDYVNDTILDRLKKFTHFFELFIDNTDYKEALLKGDKDRKIYQLYEEDFLGI